ncbi:histone-lysine N-methyltransferase EHMT2-like isoform X1 [Poecile atricapillus]|uniref:histone-lysine N-methyltransferase EHMT2-like isoform X1 n=1 Tax=Poecile atricapillus TaxID=48891 RepID=UPI0027390B9C|nr:histone-lysine N-methyltransferase EHMT2-like isoform X1 [Poecile atricapillus]
MTSLRPLSMTSQEEDGSTCLHHAAKNGNLEMVELLLGTGQVDVNAQDNGGCTPIIWAAEHKHIEVIRRLLTRGADVTLTDNEFDFCSRPGRIHFISKHTNLMI